MQVTIGWAETEEEFKEIGGLNGEWVITEKNELIKPGVDGLPEGIKVKESLWVVGQAPHHTTDWLRYFCNEHHPEIDFDREFETDKPGVFGRYQEKFDHDYEEGVVEMQYEELKKQLTGKGYELPWEVKKSALKLVK